MKLETKFKYAEERYFEDALIKSNVKIAEEFAINFANWYEFMLRQSDDLNIIFTPEELIEMFKKEKGL